MKRPISLLCISLILGITVSFISNSYIVISISVIFALLISVIICFKYPNLKHIIIIAVLFFLLGAIEFKAVNDTNTKRFEKFSGRQVVIKGVIDSEPENSATKVSYIIKVGKIIFDNKTEEYSGKVLLSTPSEGLFFNYGNEISILGTLVIPTGRRNPGGFDYRRYLARSGISATVFAKKENIEVLQNNRGNILVKTGLILKGKIIDVIINSIPKQQAGLLNGMLIGYREGLSEEVQKAFRDSGLTHIMAVSGANILFIVVPLIFLLRNILKFNQKSANILVIGVLILFVYITGFQPSVLRAVIMAMVILAGQILRREADIYASLSFAAILLLLYNPALLFDIGFQLSFTATLSIVLFFKNIRGIINFKYIPSIIEDIIAATLAAQVGVLPISVYYFNNISLISLVTNVIVLPIVEIITVIGSLMAIFGQFNLIFSQTIGYVISPLLSFVLYTTKIASSIPYAVIQVVTPSILYIVVYYLMFWFLLWYKPLHNFKIKAKHYIIAFIFAGLIISLPHLLPHKLQVVFIDVGQGDCEFIKTYSGETVLIDGGGFNAVLNPGRSSIGDTTTIPFLLDYGVSSLDIVVATHGHDDHIQGLEAVLERFPVKNLVIPDIDRKKEFEKIIKIAENKNIKVVFCQQGDIIKLDDKTNLTVLFPKKNFKIDQSPLNNGSLVLKLQYKKTTVIFTGDIEDEAEHLLLSEGTDLKADVLKVAHHGSSYSSTDEFLSAVNPDAAVISVGKNNFGHPSMDTIGRLTSRGTQVFRTDQCGALILTSDGDEIKISKTVESEK